MQPLSQAIKETRQDKEFIMYLIRKGRIAYAHNPETNAYLVSVDDINYHLEQVRLRRLGDVAINRVKHERILRQANVPEATIHLAFAKSIKPIAKSRKRF